MTVKIFIDSFPRSDYLPTTETIIYNHRTYTVYRSDHPLSFGKKICLAVKAVMSFFKYGNYLSSFKCLEKRAIFVHSKSSALEAVTKRGWNLFYTHENLKQDMDIVLAAVKQDSQAWLCAHEGLQRDKKFIFSALNRNGLVFLHLPKHLQNKRFALAAVRQNSKALNLLPDYLKRDREVVLEAIKKKGCALQFAHESLKQDRKFILETLEYTCSALPFISEHLKQDRAFFLKLLKKNGLALEHASMDLKKDKEIVMEAIKQNKSALNFAHTNLKEDKGFILAISKNMEQAMLFAHPNLKKDKEFILEIAKQNLAIFKYISEVLKKDKEFILEAVKQDGLALQHLRCSDPFIIEAAHHSLKNRLQLWLDKPDKATALFKYTSYIVKHPLTLFLHEEHPVLQQAIEAYCIASSSNDPKGPYQMYHNLKKVIEEEALVDGFYGFRKRVERKKFTFADIPDGIIPLKTLFETMEQKGINKEEVAELCNGASLQDIKDNVLREDRIIPSLLMQKGKKEDRLPITTMYLYAILKCISEADDTRKENHLSPRESQLLKFASMVKECATGQADAIEQYYINTIGIGALNSSQSKIEETIDHTTQTALKMALASDALLRELMGKEPVQQSHQTLYLQNRYHRQIGLIHTLRFDRYTGLIDSALIESPSKKILKVIRKHLKLTEMTKQRLDQALKGALPAKITYMEFIAYFEKEFDLTADKYVEYVEFDEKMNPIGITQFAVEKMLKKLGYTYQV
jgi:hypothetical protein